MHILVSTSKQKLGLSANTRQNGTFCRNAKSHPLSESTRIGIAARRSSEARFLDRLLDAFPNGIKRVVPVAVLFKIPPALTPSWERIELIEEFAVVLEIHRIKNHWHYLYLAVFVACLRSWQFHVLDVVGGAEILGKTRKPRLLKSMDLNQLASCSQIGRAHV